MGGGIWVAAGSGAAINVAGNGSAANIGRGGTGTLNVLDGGKVALSSTGNATARIGRDGGIGTATINGSGSQFTVQSGNGLARVLVGDGVSSPGTLNVNSGGMVTAQEVAVSANGTLSGGGGVIDALVSVNGGVLAPGNSPGTMTIDGNLAFNSGKLEIQIAELNADFLDVTGTATFAGGSFAISSLNGLQPAPGSQWTILRAAGGVSGWAALNIVVDGLGSGYSYGLAQAGNELNFSVAAVPEPETYVLMLGGIALVAFAVRRRKRD